jgi:hypothetical protein
MPLQSKGNNQHYSSMAVAPKVNLNNEILLKMENLRKIKLLSDLRLLR